MKLKNKGCLVDIEELWLKVNLVDPYWREEFLNVYTEVKILNYYREINRFYLFYYARTTSLYGLFI